MGAVAEIQTFGLETILNYLIPEDYTRFDSELKETLDDFKVVSSLNEKFVPPILSSVAEYTTAEIKDACIILIEAVGASGKTELTKHLSYRLQCPILDLGTTKVVAGNSLTGLLNKRMRREDAGRYMDYISEGKSTIIIDALDEGYMKTNNQGYLDFLDDVLSLEPKSSCPIIMAGRYNAVELAALYLDEKEIPFITLQIEPFTLLKAKDFIDNSVKNMSKIRFAQVYRDTRDYLLETIGGFFRDQGSIKNKASERFLGYAPVLQSIAAFFDENTNYQVVLQELQERRTRSVSLIVDVIERILERDRKEKVFPNFLDPLISERSEEFKELVRSVVYTNEEQCARILYKVMNRPFPNMDIDDPSFEAIYNEHISAWIDEHPFLGKNEIGNIVFESYILATLVPCPKYRNAAYDYIKSHGVSYMFAYIYKELHGFAQIDNKILPYIYSSFAELNSPQSYYTMHLDYVQDKDVKKLCEFEFVGSEADMEVYDGTVSYSPDDIIDFGDSLRNISINVPMDYCLSGRKVHLSAPVYIRCNNFNVNSEELVLCKGCANEGVMFECQAFNVEQMYEQYVKVSRHNSQANGFAVVSPEKLDYPFYEFWTSEQARLNVLSPENLKKYVKFRAIILEFRSHSKRELAKHHEKIDFVLGGTELGKKVIESMLGSRIMFKEGHLYKLNTDLMDEVFGLSYDGIRNFEVTPDVISFLDGIQL